uniref:ATP-binding protein n=1 Tax=Butyrivibrio sp. TaxID=28121 RepID=UPI0025D2FFA8
MQVTKFKLRDIDQRWKRNTYVIVRILIWLVLTRLCVYVSLHSENLIITTGDTVLLSFIMFPFLLLGALYGYVLSYISFIIAFVITYIMSMDTAYNMITFLVGTSSFALFSQYFWFKTKKKTLCAALYTTIFVALAEYACYTVIKNEIYSISSLLGIFMYIAASSLEIFIVAIAMYIFYNKMPDRYKIVFPLGFGYTRIFQESIGVQKAIKKTRVSLKMTVIIISIEVILGISVALFMIALFPDMKKMLIESVRNGSSVLPSVTSGEADSEDFIAGLENMNYVFDASAITYDIKMILLMLCVGVPLGGFANYYTKSTIGTPIGYMSDFMYDFANADDEKKLEVASQVDDIRVNSKDEIEVLASYLKSTIHSIEDYIDKLKEDQKLQTELEVAQKSSEAKSSFLSNMSHEIRTPINAILGMNEMILRQDNDPEILEYAMNIKSAGNSLLSIINDILDFSKIEAGKMDILPVNYNLSSMINDLVNMISVRAEGKGLDINVNVDENIPDQLEGDEVRIKQCVTNILTNAVKYTEKGSVTMEVTYKEADDDNISLRFTVSDTGIGIKEEDLNKLFSPFERIEETRNRTIEGTGLGMSIVKKLLAMMDTKLEVKSVYGEGSEFSFEIIQKVVNREAIGDFKKRYKEYIKGLKKYHEKYHAPDAKVLVVDDTPMNLTVVKGLLKATRIQ